MCHLLLHHLRKVKYFIARETLTEYYDQCPGCLSPLTPVKAHVHYGSYCRSLAEPFANILHANNLQNPERTCPRSLSFVPFR